MAKKKPALNDILKSLENYRVQLYESKTISATEFLHMQTALHGAKNIVRDCFGEPRKADTAWIK